MVIPKLVGKFQMITSKQINILRNTPGLKNWQPNYHDRVIRDNVEYQTIHNYILSNPMNWDRDMLNNKVQKSVFICTPTAIPSPQS